MGISAELGQVKEVALPGGRIRYHETGAGPVVVFVHGALVNADLWRKVVPGIAAAGFRCVTPDWPLGSHSIPVPGLDLTPTGLADLIATFLEQLGLTDVTLVANDTGGAISQILLTRRPERIGRVVLTSCDAYDNFLPPPFTVMSALARIPGSMLPLLAATRLPGMTRSPLAFGWVTKRRVPDAIVDSYLRPGRTSGAIRKDLRRFLKAIDSRYTAEAATRFGEIRQPVLLAWAREDKLFPPAHAERMRAELPDAALTFIDDSYAFLPEDQPELLTERILEFTRLHATS
ncbi:alpha/beta fold hydrolase [Nocardia sp. NPDC127579]|uniref:alpha/beta fold hydrolase n=1 Tax=Nocardia sp. NPDC127579 TaxID=3345402 RepID=UPI00364067E6